VAAVELANAYVSLAVSSKGLGKDIVKQFGGVEKQAESTGKRAGSRLMAGLGKAAKRTAVGAGVAAGAAVGAAVVSGFNTAMARDKSQRVMSGLYGNAKLATQTLADLRKVAHDSPIDYVNYAKAGESLAYAGVEGKQATKILDGVGKSIVVAGGGSEKLDQAMGGVLKAVNNGGIAMMDSISMISESGYPIMDGLSEKFGVTSDVIKKMASQGKISIEDVLDVMENSTGKLAQANNKAYGSVVQGFGDSWKSAKDIVSNAVADVILPLLNKIAPAVRPAAEALARGISDVPAIFQTIADAGGKVWNVLKDWSPLIFSIVGAFAAYNAVLGISNALSWARYLIEQRSLILGATRIALTNGMAAAQAALNAVMSANPIGLIVAGLVLLVGGLVMAYKKLGWFRDFVDAVWAGIKVAAQAVGDWFMNTLWPGIKAAVDGIGSVFTWLYQNAIKPAWDGIKAAIDVVVGWFNTSVAPGVQATTMDRPGCGGGLDLTERIGTCPHRVSTLQKSATVPYAWSTRS
jgi:tape measure domain-containing protein